MPPTETFKKLSAKMRIQFSKQLLNSTVWNSLVQIGSQRMESDLTLQIKLKVLHVQSFVGLQHAIETTLHLSKTPKLIVFRLDNLQEDKSTIFMKFVKFLEFLI
jgi:hypothetical protein